MVSGVTTAYNREQLWLANESLIAKLQARCRGFLVRKRQRERMSFLKSQDPAVSCIQVRYTCNTAIILSAHIETAVCCEDLLLYWLSLLSQAHWKGHQQRKKFKDRKQYLKDHSEEAIKVTLLCNVCKLNISIRRTNTVKTERIYFCLPQIQSMVRMHQARKKYKDRLKYFQDHVSVHSLKPGWIKLAANWVFETIWKKNQDNGL